MRGNNKIFSTLRSSSTWCKSFLKLILWTIDYTFQSIRYQKNIMIPISYPSPRVSQLDAGILDSELFSLLKEQLSSIFQLHSTSRYSFSQHLELYSLLLNLLIFRLTVWKSGSSYGSSLQNLKLTDSRSGKIIGSSRKALLGAVIIGGYLYKKLESYLFLDESSTQNSHSTLDKLKNYLLINRTSILSGLENSLKIANLVNFTFFSKWTIFIVG